MFPSGAAPCRCDVVPICRFSALTPNYWRVALFIPRSPQNRMELWGIEPRAPIGYTHNYKSRKSLIMRDLRATINQSTIGETCGVTL